VAGRRDWTRETLLAGVRSGDRRALARAITLVEGRDALAYDLVRDIYPETGGTYAIGVTGPPGVGKSSLISALVRLVREQERTVGVISVDPSSPFTHGALLGDRIRLSDHFLDPEVFIRSMSTWAVSPRRRSRRCSCSTRPARTSSSSRRSVPARARSR
jgi:LAO/AO transport system kinase